MKVKERRIVTANHIRQLLAEQINLLRQDEELETVERARAIAYLSNISLTAIKEGELEGRIALLEENLRLKNRAMQLEIEPDQKQNDKLLSFAETIERTYKDKKPTQKEND